ncbi:hypothetical protein NE237_026034 [Protea cynaroides]|uniref:RING-type E3 ubiquitin transferase n=1 Tax=Protea cynaroides TaxID=273540 RepID=A0A9Q0K2B6_9MAGN|nr:hypothetical protein NE237_026034 [Protea cynaroides]
MPPSVNIQSLRAYYSNESLINSDILGPKASIHFKVQHQQFLVTIINGGSETSPIEVRPPFVWPEHVFNIEFPYLLLPLVLENYIHDMLTHVEIPPSTMEGLKRHISTYAFHMALICRQRKSRFLDIVVDLNVQLVETMGEEDTEELDQEVMLMDINADNGGFSFVPASSNSIQALEIKEFDDNIEEEETCMICMDEFERGIEIAKLPCSHFFHSKCILKWLKNKNSCPLCRFAMLTEED